MPPFFSKGNQMKTKTISAILNGKFKKWLASISDPEVRALAEKNTIITGGSIASMLLDEKVNDYDLYFRDKQTTLAVAEYYVKEFARFPPPHFKRGDRDVKISVLDSGDRIKIMIKSVGVVSADGDRGEYQYFESLTPDDPAVTEYAEHVCSVLQETKEEKSRRAAFSPLFMSSNAITLTGDIQLIIRFFGEPEQIHENYDFIHCMNYWTSWDKKVVTKKEALEALLAKELVYVGSLYPICSMIRTRKFIKRGWSINAGQFLRMAYQVHNLDLNDVDVLEDQLIGVDAAYFNELISALREKSSKTVDQTYLMELIDRIF